MEFVRLLACALGGFGEMRKLVCTPFGFSADLVHKNSICDGCSTLWRRVVFHGDSCRVAILLGSGAQLILCLLAGSLDLGARGWQLAPSCLFRVYLGGALAQLCLCWWSSALNVNDEGVVIGVCVSGTCSSLLRLCSA